ncbi:MAG TPA: crossover junction endodeoxyribonuclease RuvC [Bryobacteraceae bacterium]|nr:crossover junction endodeoxyribonuclease RuvC [Bryobacteraceae bacterium]
MRHPQVPEVSRILLGIDPGLRVTGFGLVACEPAGLSRLHHGAIRTTAPDRPGRLVQIYRCICDLLDNWTVEEVALEKQFVAINPSSAFAIGEARAVAMLAVAQRGIPIFEYAPAEIKQSVTSYGRGTKQQIQEMVRLQFGLSAPPQPVDAADALAIAICHAARRSIISSLAAAAR